MAFVVSARKYRPSRFEDVVGQAHISQTLKKALQTDHVAHAFLFCGPRGVGKTTCARILAKVLNCQQLTADFEPCGTCSSCKAFNENASFNIVELDAASYNGVDHIRALVEQVRFQPQQGRYKVFIIDEVHMLSVQAFNAFLKTLEEPPPYAVFILATTEKHKIIPTILSRCQIFDFKRIQVRDIAAHLQHICDLEQIEADPEALHIIAQKADGALRDALSIFDRITSFSGKKIAYADVISNLNVLDYDYFFRFTDALLSENLRQVMLIFDEVLRNGFEGDHFVNGLAEHLRNLLVSKDKETLNLLEVGDYLKSRYAQQAAIAPPSFLLTGINLCNECDINYKQARNKRLHVEMTLMKLCFSGQAVQLAAIASDTSPSAGSMEKKTADVKSPAQLPKEKNPAKTSGEPASEVHSDTVPTANNPAPPEVEKKQAAAKEAPPSMPPGDPSSGGGGASGSLRVGKAGSLPRLQSLESLHAEVAHATQNSAQKTAVQVSEFALSAAWDQYIASIDKDSVKTILRGAEIALEKDQISVVVGSALAESIVRQETGLMEFLRKQLQAPQLSMSLRLDPARSNASPAKPRRLSDKEKYWAMVAVNPLVAEFQKRFDLKLENE